jgi:hypothetical protein
MRFRSLTHSDTGFALDLPEQRLPEQRQGAVPADAPEARLQLQQGGGEPAVLLVGGIALMPVISGTFCGQLRISDWRGLRLVVGER